MIRSRLAKNLIFISLFALIAEVGASADPFEVIPHFKCGTYRVRGIFEQNTQGDFILTLRQGSSSPFELIVLGGNLEEKLSFVGSPVTLEVYVPKEIKSNHQPFVFLQSMKRAPSTDFEKRLLKSEACRNSKKYHRSR